MPILGTLIKKGIKIRESLDQQYTSPEELQKNQLKKLLISASETLFGKRYGFNIILEHYQSSDPQLFYQQYQKLVPLHNYNQLYNDWWHLSQEGQSDVCWPGDVKYFALSSGTSEATSKYIPITDDMVKAIRKTSIRQIVTLSKYELPTKFFQGGILMLGGSTHLNYNGRYFEGDLSGIQAAQLPFWFQHFYKPGKKIAQTVAWDEKLSEIVRQAREWDISIIVGVPAWIQILIEKILSHHQVSNIHEIWPNLEVYVHGGVSFDPYRKGFGKLLGKPIHYIETYLASEGFIAFQANPDTKSMRLVLNNGMFYEFVPFNDQNFDSENQLLPGAETLMINEVEEGKEYAILLSTCAGAWRYLIGDVVKIIDKNEAEIVITGRTKHFLSLCGEHLSVDNMNKAIEIVAEEFNISIKEFTVTGEPNDTLFAHRWYLGVDEQIDEQRLKERLDQVLMGLNDDYKVERGAALQEVFVEVLPIQLFYDWMKTMGKEGGQNKFPRVLKNEQLDDWKTFLKSKV
jgi:hypothetical protein